MAATSGTITLAADFIDALPVSAARLTAFNLPVRYVQALAVTNGAGPGLASKCYQSTTTLNAAAASIDLTAVTCTDGTTGFAHVRGLFVFNTDTTASHSVKIGDDGVGTNIFLGGFLGTAPQRTVQASGFYADVIPIATNGYTVDSSHKNLRFDPGANLVVINIIVVGD